MMTLILCFAIIPTLFILLFVTIWKWYVYAHKVEYREFRILKIVDVPMRTIYYVFSHANVTHTSYKRLINIVPWL